MSVESQQTLDFGPWTLDLFARVAQLMERWSYKPEVEGLSPSLGTKETGGRRQVQEAGILGLPAACRLPPAS